MSAFIAGAVLVLCVCTVAYVLDMRRARAARNFALWMAWNRGFNAGMNSYPLAKDMAAKMGMNLSEAHEALRSAMRPETWL